MHAHAHHSHGQRSPSTVPGTHHVQGTPSHNRTQVGPRGTHPSPSPIHSPQVPVPFSEVDTDTQTHTYTHTVTLTHPLRSPSHVTLHPSPSLGHHCPHQIDPWGSQMHTLSSRGYGPDALKQRGLDTPTSHVHSRPQTHPALAPLPATPSPPPGAPRAPHAGQGTPLRPRRGGFPEPPGRGAELVPAGPPSGP